MKYEDRYLALVDIIGFSSWILSEQNEACASTLAAIYDEIRVALRPYREDVSAEWIDLTLFSDTIVLSTRAQAQDQHSQLNTISEFLWCVRRVALIVLKHGFLSRGCVLRDRVTHNNDVVIGPAIITAHEYESKVARFPRILVIRNLRETMERHDHLRRWLQKSTDGPRYLHILYEFEKFFRAIPSSGETDAERHPTFKFALGAHSTIDRNLSKTADHPERFEKVRWFANYFNKSVLTVYKSESPNWPKPFEIAEYY